KASVYTLEMKLEQFLRGRFGPLRVTPHRRHWFAFDWRTQLHPGGVCLLSREHWTETQSNAIALQFAQVQHLFANGVEVDHQLNASRIDLHLHSAIAHDQARVVQGQMTGHEAVREVVVETNNTHLFHGPARHWGPKQNVLQKEHDRWHDPQRMKPAPLVMRLVIAARLHMETLAVSEGQEMAKNHVPSACSFVLAKLSHSGRTVTALRGPRCVAEVKRQSYHFRHLQG